MRWGLIIALALGCGPASGPAADEATGGAETTVGAESAPRDALAELGPAESGVRFGRLELGAGERLQVDASSCREGLVFVQEGALEGLAAGAVRRDLAPFEVVATAPSALLVAFAGDGECAAEEDGGEASLASTETLPFAGGKLRVQILLDAPRGARHAAFSLLDGDADLPVPPHVHEGSVEALFIVSGDGTMLRGDERFPIAPGRVVIVPAGVRHGYEAGTEPLRAYQIYHPPGPEQRFRASAPATPPAPTEEP